jgi:DNA invertase Pin-like site-specific DNA recombinase
MSEQELKFKEKLEKLLETNSKTDLAIFFGISRQAFYKWLKKYNVNYVDIEGKPRGKNINELNKLADELLNSNK